MWAVFPHSTIDKPVLEIQDSQRNSVDTFKKSEGPITFSWFIMIQTIIIWAYLSLTVQLLSRREMWLNAAVTLC